MYIEILPLSLDGLQFAGGAQGGHHMGSICCSTKCFSSMMCEIKFKYVFTLNVALFKRVVEGYRKLNSLKLASWYS